MDDLRRATAALYHVFSIYPLKPKIEVCPDCELDAAEASLHTRSLRELRWKDFGVYPFKAMTTFGDEGDFKHFLPRIFELYLLDHKSARYDAAIVFDKLNYANWTSWPESETAAIRAFVTSWLQSLTVRQQEAGGDFWQLEELRSALADSGFDAVGAA
jgi:hypothetical protein